MNKGKRKPKITQTVKETETGWMFTQVFPKGILNPYVDEVKATHVTSWKKMRELLDKATI